MSPYRSALGPETSGCPADQSTWPLPRICPSPRRPLISEKSTKIKETTNTVCFEVDPRANKIDIRKAVDAVNTEIFEAIDLPLAGDLLVLDAEVPERAGRLGFVERVVSPERVLTPEVADLARAVEEVQWK